MLSFIALFPIIAIDSFIIKLLPLRTLEYSGFSLRILLESYLYLKMCLIID